MSDIYCAVCGEPWDAYGVTNGDLALEDIGDFLAGKGCPCCHFGWKGTGILQKISDTADKRCNHCGAWLDDEGLCSVPCTDEHNMALKAAISEVEASDEEPIGILAKRGLI